MLFSPILGSVVVPLTGTTLVILPVFIRDLMIFNISVDIHRVHLTLVADQLGHAEGVIAAARADVRDDRAWLDLQGR